jgi:hypothetical protein
MSNELSKLQIAELVISYTRDKFANSGLFTYLDLIEVYLNEGNIDKAIQKSVQARECLIRLDEYFTEMRNCTDKTGIGWTYSRGEIKELLISMKSDVRK